MVDYRETSTMISDGVLALVAYIAGVYRVNMLRAFSWRHATLAWFGMFGFGFIGFAAVMGVVRFGYFFPYRQYLVKGWHHYFTDLASVIGLPLLAGAFSQRTSWLNLCWFLLALSIIGTLLHCINPLRLFVRDLCAGTGILVITISALIEVEGTTNWYSLGGVGTIILAALVSDQGLGVKSIKNVDLFHYLMVVALVLLSQALLA